MKNGAKMEAKMVPKSMKSGSQRPSKNNLTKHVQKVWKMEPKGVPIGSQNGAQDAPERSKLGCKIRMCFWEPLGSLLGSILAPVLIDFHVFYVCLGDVLVICG